VALRLVCEREAVIRAFEPQQFWSLEVEVALPDGSVRVVFSARQWMIGQVPRCMVHATILDAWWAKQT
jgi:DNA topoisomerase IA